MWQELITCMAPREVAFCIPMFEALGGPAFPIYWYGILAALGILVGATYARWHVEREGEDPEMIWDMLLWVLPAGLLGGRLWYVAQAVFLDGSTQFSLQRPFEIIWPRFGGLNILGGAIAAVLAGIVFLRTSKNINNKWVFSDAGLLGLFIGHAIGRIGNLINIELYGPPTGSPWFGILVPAQYRLAEFPISSFPLETRFHPTMLYEAAWLALCFGVLVYLFYRNQAWFKPGILTGLYFLLAGVGRFFVEFLRPDQPNLARITGQATVITFSQIVAVLMAAVGLILLLDRLSLIKIPFIKLEKPVTDKQRARALDDLARSRRRLERSRERASERQRRAAARDKLREERRSAPLAGASTAESAAPDDADGVPDGLADIDPAVEATPEIGEAVPEGDLEAEATAAHTEEAERTGPA